MKKIEPILALALAAGMSAASPAPVSREPSASAAANGVPFYRLQRQVDKLRERLAVLEAASPAGQSCPEGQFVTGFSATGGLLCASAQGGSPQPPAPPAPPGPIPESFKAALQQALSALAVQDRGLDFAPQTIQIPFGPTLTVQPLSYDLEIGAVQIVQSAAASATITIQIPRFALDIHVSSGSQAATPAVSAAGTAILQVRVLSTPSGARKLGTLLAADLVPSGSFTLSNGGTLTSVLNQLLAQFDDIVLTVVESELGALINPLLASLPEF